MPHVDKKSKMPHVDKKLIKGARHAYFECYNLVTPFQNESWAHSVTQGIS